MRDIDATRERFIAAIADRVNPAAIEELHLFQPIRQGGTESGVAVVAVNERPSRRVRDLQPTGAEGAAENLPDALGASAENDVVSAENDVVSAESGFSGVAVYTATYRLILKGPDRGKWEFGLQAEADAPLITVDRVVRGVQRRSGDAEDAEKLSGEEFRALLPQREGASETSRAD